MLKDNSTVCFLGDSITADGRWIFELYEFFKEQNKKIYLYNCGIPGGKVSSTLERLEEDCFNHNPDTVVCMFGLNDINYHLYGEKYYFSEEERNTAIREFEESLVKLVEIMNKKNITVILLTPPPYGQWNKSDAENLVHANQGVAILLEIYKRIAKENNLVLIDINSLFMKYIKEDRLINPDRLHPTAPGHHLISQGFLKGVSMIDEINRDYPTKRCEMNTLRYREEQIIRGIMFVKWHILKDLMGESTGFIKSKAQEEMKKYTPKDFFYNQLEIYINNIDDIKEHQRLLDKYTKE